MTDGASILRGPLRPYPGGVHIDRIIQRAAQREPSAPALICRGAPTTYAALDGMASHAAAALAARGIGKGDVVAVRFTRSPELVAVLLAVMKRGAAYAAIPPDWPRARHQSLVALTGARLTVRDPAQAMALIDEGRAAQVPPDPVRAPGDPFCVFLTSGSTGVPRAVLAPHRGVARTALDPLHVLDERMITLQSSAPAWDVFALELWVPLLRGGTCVLYQGTHLTTHDIRDAIRSGVNILCIPPVLLDVVLQDDPDCLAGLRILFTGGDRASAVRHHECTRRFPRLRLVHVYGPVENTIATTVWHVRDVDPGREVPLGMPVVNTDVYLVGDNDQPVARGATGEVVITGDGLALGYLGAPDETARRFQTLLLAGRPQRAYRTGDLCRVDAGGLLVFCGRTDRQVKVRGVRIEPEEIERAVEAVAGVGRAVAVALPRGARAKTHVAVAYTQSVPGDLRSRIRQAAGEALPAGLRPDLLVPVDSLPSLPNGKLDYRGADDLIPAPVADTGRPDTGRPDTGRPDTGRPDTGRPRAQTIADIIAELLPGETVGADDDIFERGATSLTAIQIANRLTARLGQKVTAADVLAAGTAVRISELLETRPTQGPADDQERLWPGGLPASQLVIYQLSMQEPDGDECLLRLVYRLHGPVDRDLLGQGLLTVVRGHEALHTCFRPGTPPRIHRLDPRVIPPVLTAHGPATPDDAQAAADEFLRRPFDLAHEVPLRALLVPLGPDDHLLALAIHNIAFDGWSERRLWVDLVAAYTELAAGRTPAPRTPTAFHRVIADRDRSQLAEQEKYRRIWAERLAGTPPLPLDGPATASAPALTVEFPITPELVREAAAVAVAVRGTATCVALAAFARALGELAGARDLAVQLTMAARTTPEAEDVVGCFATWTAVRFRDVTVPAADLVRTAADWLRAVMIAPTFPVAELYQVPAGARRHPLFQAAFAMHDYSGRAPCLPGVRRQTRRLYPDRLRSDVALDLWPAEGYGLLRGRRDVLAPWQAERLVTGWTTVMRELTTELRNATGSRPGT